MEKFGENVRGGATFITCPLCNIYIWSLLFETCYLSLTCNLLQENYYYDYSATHSYSVLNNGKHPLNPLGAPLVPPRDTFGTPFETDRRRQTDLICSWQLKVCYLRSMCLKI